MIICLIDCLIWCFLRLLFSTFRSVYFFFFFVDSSVPTSSQQPSLRLKVRWAVDKSDLSNNGGITQTSLSQHFTKYGKLNFVILSQKKPGSAIIEFSSAAVADAAFRAERNSDRFELEWIVTESEPAAPSHAKLPDNPAPNHSTRPSVPSSSTAAFNHADFEAQVLARMTAAAKRKQMDLSA